MFVLEYYQPVPGARASGTPGEVQLDCCLSPVVSRGRDDGGPEVVLIDRLCEPAHMPTENVECDAIALGNAGDVTDNRRIEIERTGLGEAKHRGAGE